MCSLDCLFEKHKHNVRASWSWNAHIRKICNFWIKLYHKEWMFVNRKNGNLHVSRFCFGKKKTTTENRCDCVFSVLCWEVILIMRWHRILRLNQKLNAAAPMCSIHCILEWVSDWLDCPWFITLVLWRKKTLQNRSKQRDTFYVCTESNNYKNLFWNPLDKKAPEIVSSD